jgi:uncharacterized DUF497 family protein
MPYKIGCVEFEWDILKAASNVEKHGVDFDTATEIFDDPDLIVIIDSRTYGERRYKAIGASRGMILFAAYTMRGEGVCRIISARRASRRERSAYTLPTWA